jgi:hypothetical protein
MLGSGVGSQFGHNPLLHQRFSRPILLTAVLVLAAAAATRIVTLPLSIVVMVVLETLLLAYHLAAAHRTA